MATVQLKQIRKSYDDFEVIKGIDLKIHDQELTVFVGPSGCGKSTLLRLIAGLEEITSGDLLINGEKVNSVPASKRGLAIVFQSYALYPHMNVAENMPFSLKLAGVPMAERQKKVLEAARILNLETYLDRKPKTLSGGQRQRVAIGRAIVRDPKVFLFDEPLSNLDAALRVRMRLELTKLHQTSPAVARHDDLCNPRPGRSDDNGGPHRCSTVWRGRAGRFSYGSLSLSTQSLCRGIHRISTNEFPRNFRSASCSRWIDDRFRQRGNASRANAIWHVCDGR